LYEAGAFRWAAFSVGRHFPSGGIPVGHRPVARQAHAAYWPSLF